MYLRRDSRGKKIQGSVAFLRTQRAPGERTDEIIDPTLRDQSLNLIADRVDRSDQDRFSREAGFPREKIVIGVIILLMPELQDGAVPIVVRRLRDRKRSENATLAQW